MYHFDLSGKFNSFYSSCVVLSQDEQNKLSEKKDLNIQRLEDGFRKYNEEHNTSYKLKETCVQGSMAMHTVVQNNEKDYDIDVAIVFEKDDLGDLGTLATRNMVAAALKKKTKQFASDPEVKTSCVRVIYQEGYHVDFAVFRRYKNDSGEYVYEHAGAEWSERGLKAIDEWFEEEIKDKGDILRKVVRLSKMFCKSRDSWVNMPSGLLQTVLVDEKIATSYTRSDEVFYYTMQAIVDRLESSLEVVAPVDNGRPLIPRKADLEKMKNWKNNLTKKLKKLEILFDSNYTEDDAVDAWFDFFNHDFWVREQLKQSETNSFTKSGNGYVTGAYGFSYQNTEEFIESRFQVSLSEEVSIRCKVSGNGIRSMWLWDFLAMLPGGNRFVPHHFSVDAFDYIPEDIDLILWKVKNVGKEAEKRNQIRGQILERGEWIHENTMFRGNHYIECYFIRNGVCVRRGRVNVPIGAS